LLGALHIHMGEGHPGELEELAEEPHILGARTLGALAFIERNPLALPEILESNAFDGRHVEKQVFSRAGLDEAESLVRYALNGAFTHGGRTLAPYSRAAVDKVCSEEAIKEAIPPYRVQAEHW